MKRFITALILFVFLSGTFVSADDGMFTFDNPPDLSRGYFALGGTVLDMSEVPPQALLSLVGAAGALHSTTTDLVRFLDALFTTDDLVSRASREHMMEEGAIGDAIRHIALYKRLRPFQQQGSAILLSAQVPPREAGGWDAVEFLIPGGRDAAVMVYNSFDSPPIAHLRVKGLRPDDTYQVESADAGFLGTASGRELMEHGIELHSGDLALSLVIFLHAE